MEGPGRTGFRVGAGYLWLAARLSEDESRLAEFWELAAFGSAMQTLSVGLIAEFGERVDDREITLTFRALEAFRTDPPFDVREYRYGIAEIPGDPELAYETMWAALQDEARRIFDGLSRKLRRDPNSFYRSVERLWVEVRRRARISPALWELARELGLPEGANLLGVLGRLLGLR